MREPRPPSAARCRPSCLSVMEAEPDSGFLRSLVHAVHAPRTNTCSSSSDFVSPKPLRFTFGTRTNSSCGDIHIHTHIPITKHQLHTADSSSVANKITIESHSLFRDSISRFGKIQRSHSLSNKFSVHAVFPTGRALLFCTQTEKHFSVHAVFPTGRALFSCTQTEKQV